MDAQELRHNLKEFTGCEQPFRHSLNPRVIYTDGVRYFAQHAGHGAYWFLDILATEPDILRHVKAGFASIVLKSDGHSAVIIAKDDDHQFFERHINFTDCPEGNWEFYFIDNTILLPSEY